MYQILEDLETGTSGGGGVVNTEMNYRVPYNLGNVYVKCFREHFYEFLGIFQA
jgi:hypothetical protein